MVFSGVINLACTKLISLEHQCLPFYSLFTCVPVCIFIDQCLKSSLMKECLNSICKAETNQSYKKQYISIGLLTKCEVKIAGYWPSSFFLREFMDRDGVEVHKHAKKS